MISRVLISLLFAYSGFVASVSFAAPWGLPQTISDENMKILFEVHAPWNILDGTAEQASGKVSLADHNNPGSLNADVAVQNLKYKAGLSMAGRLVSVWLNANPPTPAKFVIAKSNLNCTPETLSIENPCKGSVDGKLTIWSKDHTIDVPVEMKPIKAGGYLLEGAKKIRWGEYGFGDPNATIATLKPVIMLNFSIDLPKGDSATGKPEVAAAAEKSEK